MSEEHNKNTDEHTQIKRISGEIPDETAGGIAEVIWNNSQRNLVWFLSRIFPEVYMHFMADFF